MKTVKILTSVASIVISTIAGVQVYSYSDNTPDQRNILQYGIKAGVNNSDLYDTKGQNFAASPLFGPVFGGFLSIPLGAYFGIQPEVLYSAKGYSGTGTIPGAPSSASTLLAFSNSTNPGAVTGTPAGVGVGQRDPQNFSYTDRLNYIDIPVMLQIKPFTNLYLLGGPEYSYLISRSYTFTQGVTSETTQQQFENYNIRHNVFGYIVGADINFAAITLGGRIAWDEMDNNGNGTSTLPRYRNYWGQLTLGFRL
jgi:Outer membrane protein beta-barrel domain